MDTDGTQPDAGFGERFFRYFQNEVTALQEQMSRLSSTSLAGGERTDAIDHCLAGIARLSHEVTDASQHLPAYDQRTYAEAVKALGEKLETVRAELAPRPRFTFRGQLKARGRGVKGDEEEKKGTKKENEGEAAAAVVADGGDVNEHEDCSSSSEGDKLLQEINARIREEKATIHRPVFSGAPQISLSNHSEANIQLTSCSAPAGSSSILRNLTSCVVDLSAASPGAAPLAGLTLRDVSHSVIVCGIVSGPIHITNMTNSILVVACQQFRMHECKNVDVYLHCGSKPIVEDVETVRFTPLPEVYLDGNLSEVKNHWDQVDDFKWLKAEPNPNWSILPDSSRLDEVFWTRTMVNEDLKAVDILQAAKLAL